MKTFKHHSQIPRLTKKGFKVMRCPQEVWGIIKDAYTILKSTETTESFQGKSTYIPTGESNILSFDKLPAIKSLIHKQLQPLHEEFSGVKLSPSFIYGIRSYKHGATLTMHRDRIETHHVAAIIIVGKDLRCGCNNKEFGADWPLDIIDHEGVSHQVFAEPGDMILYEAAKLEHGRKNTFEGLRFDNFFVHYKIQ